MALGNVKNRKVQKIVVLSLLAAVMLIVITALCIFFWYNNSLKPVSNSSDTVEISIKSGVSPSQIGELLEGKGVIQSQVAFSWYVRVNDLRNSLKAGDYQFSPSQSVQDITKTMVDGDIAYRDITIYPGVMLTDPTTDKLQKGRDVESTFIAAGFDASAVAAALSASYDSPVLASKPKNLSLEGYILPETYRFGLSNTPNEAIAHMLDVLYEKMQENGTIEAAKKQNMTIHQTLTLASIIEKEVSDVNQMAQVSGVFHNRLAKGMELGSDVTTIYAADSQNVPRTLDIDSRYNTRIYKGLPPGPIAAPSFAAIEAAVSPAKNDYLYFVAGDDGTIYYSKTLAEHEANAKKYCIKLCESL